MTSYDADGNRDTVLNRARRFFRDNPDEVLTRDDVQVKFGCGPDMANLVARTLILEGVVTREQLPRPPWASGRADVLAGQRQPFPLCLTPAQRSAVEALVEHGSINAAAQATGRTYNTLTDLLQGARRRAGVHTSVELVAMFVRASTGQPEAEAA